MLIRHDDKRTSRNTRKSRGYEAKAEPKKTLPEWLSSGTTTRKLRELLTQDFQINKSRSAKFMMTCGLAALFHFDTKDLKDKYIPGTLNVYRTGDDMCYINVVINAFSLGRVTPSNVADELEEGHTDELSVIGDEIFPDIYEARFYGETIRVFKSMDSLEPMTVNECADYINRFVSDVMKEAEEEIKKQMRKYPDYDFEYTPDSSSTDGMVSFTMFPDCRNASCLLEGISVAARSACDEANKLYNGKDIFGGSYTLDCSDIDRPVKKLVEYLRVFDGNVHDMKKEPNVFKDAVKNDEAIYDELLNVWNGIVRLDKSLNDFLGNGFNKNVTVSFSASDMEDVVECGVYCDVYDDLKNALKNLNLMKTCGEDFLEALKAMYSGDCDYYSRMEEEIKPRAGMPLEGFSDSDIVKSVYHVKFPKFLEIMVSDG